MTELVITRKVREFLRPRSASDLHAGSSWEKTRRASVQKAVDRAHGLEKAFLAILKNKPPQGTSSDWPEPAEIHELVLRTTAKDDKLAKRLEAIAEKLWASLDPDDTTQSETRLRILAAFPDRSDWAITVAKECLQQGNWAAVEILYGSLTDVELATELAKRYGIRNSIANLLLTLGEKAIPIYASLFEVARNSREEDSVLDPLGCIGTIEAAQFFVAHLRQKAAKPHATQFFARFPHLAPIALGDLAKKKTQVGDVARTILESVQRSHADEEGPDASDAAAVAAVAAPHDGGEICARDEVPMVLRYPPWKKQKEEVSGATPEASVALTLSRMPAIEHLVTPTKPLRLHASDIARRRWVASRFDNCGLLRSDEEMKGVTERLGRKERTVLLAAYPAEVLLPLLTNKPEHVDLWYGAGTEIIACYGEPGLRALAENWMEFVTPEWIESPKLAYRRYSAPINFAWLDRTPATAALGLLPVACESDLTKRQNAQGLLRTLIRKGHHEAVTAAAAYFKNPAVTKIAADLILTANTDEFDAPKRAPTMGSAYRSKEYRPVRLKDSPDGTRGKWLPPKAMEVLDQWLAASDLHQPLYGITEIRELCDPKSLADHVWDLVRAWDINSGEDWMLHAVAHFGDDEVVRRLTPTLKGPGIASLLGVIGTDAALMELFTILARVTRPGMIKRPLYADGTENAIETIAIRRGRDVDDLEDRFVPTCDVDERGGVDIDLGLGDAKKYRVTFDQRLLPILSDEKGEPIKALPHSKNIDPAKLKAARTMVRDLAEDVSAIAALRSASLERAMNEGRTWSPTDFVTFWVKHPLMLHLARGVVWEARVASAADANSNVVSYFRVTEDGSLANADDDVFDLPKDTNAIAPLHPIRLSKEERDKWRALFADYKLVQPFDQLNREPATMTPEELASLVINRKTPESYDSKQFNDRLERAGWIPYRKSRKLSWAWALPFEDNVFAWIEVSNGAAAKVAKDRRVVAFAEVSEVVRSEVMRALSIITMEN